MLISTFFCLCFLFFYLKNATNSHEFYKKLSTFAFAFYLKLLICDFEKTSTMYDFDKIIDRSGSFDIKHEDLLRDYGRTDLLPMWIADMEWETPDFIIDALLERLEHPVLGYTKTPYDYRQTIARWILDHHGWKVEEDWVTFIPGIVKGIGYVINCFLHAGDKVIVQPPIYHPFYLTPQWNGYEVVWNPLQEERDSEGRLVGYRMDFDDLERKCTPDCRLLILANPHNPAGICWDKETLVNLAHFAAEHNLIVISDEIHCDMALFGNKHIPFASVSPEAARCSITFSAPSKTFNMAGVVSSWAVVADKELRTRFYDWMGASELNEDPMFASIAAIAALKHGEPWRREMVKYLEGNIDFMTDFCNSHIPLIQPLRPQASYLVWLDCNRMGLDHEQLLDFFINHAHLALSDGEQFGKKEGHGFMRMNVGCPRSMLRQALTQIEDAVAELGL